MNNLVRILTDVETKEPGFFVKIGDWIKANPVLFTLGILVIGLGVGYLYLATKKANKRKTKR